ncbi:MAG: hypothetical protein NTY35_10625 [Planctomycetota bacterium]|nr:hypothetical protein [Planctomycetota bacterium]
MLTTLALLVPILVPLKSPAPVADTRARYLELAAKSDAAGCQELWRKDRGSILPTIDADLEGSLKVREDAAGRALTSDEERKILDMHARALWGATQASTVGHPFILDYASSFVGWDEEQRSSFRAGQRAYSEARGALKKGDHAAALTAAKRCRELAAPLGDWWGAQMGWEAEARAQEASGNKEDALAAWSRVRMVATTISLVGDEYEATAKVAELSAALGRTQRARAAAQAAIALATELGDEAGRKALEKLASENSRGK